MEIGPIKDKIAAGNFKMQMTEAETVRYFEELKEVFEGREDALVVICPSYLAIPGAAQYIKANNLPIALGVQDVSPFEDGEFTGEVSATLAREFVEYAIIGHSERRKNFGESDDVLAKKVSTVLNARLIPIYCVPNENSVIPEGVKIVAYEPDFAIGSDNPDTPENADRVASSIRSKHQNVTHVLYGGSVKPDNVAGFTTMPNLSGVLVGRSSRDPQSFASIIEQC